MPPWPRRLAERTGAVLGMVVWQGEVRGGRQVAYGFKGARAKEAEAVLETLAALGHLVGYEGADARFRKALKRDVSTPLLCLREDGEPRVMALLRRRKGC